MPEQCQSRWTSDDGRTFQCRRPTGHEEDTIPPLADDTLYEIVVAQNAVHISDPLEGAGNYPVVYWRNP